MLNKFIPRNCFTFSVRAGWSVLCLVPLEVKLFWLRNRVNFCKVRNALYKAKLDNPNIKW